MSGETREYWEEKLAQAEKDNDEFSKRQAESRLAELDDAARDEERQQRQQAEVEAIQLPRDYDEYFGVQGLNEEIQALLRQAIAAKHEEANADIAAVQEASRKRAEADAATIAELRDRTEEAEAAAEQLQERAEAAERQLHEEKEEREAAEQKRDNAVRIAEEAQEAQRNAEQEAARLKAENESMRRQIDELEGMLRTYKSGNKPSLGGLTLTSTLPSLSEEELKARKERERLDLINRRLQEKFGDSVAPLPIPPLPSAEKAVEPADEDVTDEAIAEQMDRVTEAAAADEETFQVVPGDAGADPAAGGATQVGGDVAEADRAPTVEELAARVTNLESWVARVSPQLYQLVGKI